MLVGITAATPGNTGHALAALLIFLQPRTCVRISPKCPDRSRSVSRATQEFPHRKYTRYMYNDDPQVSERAYTYKRITRRPNIAMLTFTAL